MKYKISVKFLFREILPYFCKLKFVKSKLFLDRNRNHNLEIINQMKLWDKGFEPNKMIETFTVGQDRELDLRLARYDVEGSMAHIRMLESIGLIEKEELPVLLAALEQIRQEILDGKFIIEEGIEDVHSQVELLLTQRLGDVGKKIHSGRSRNDQVLVDLKLYFRDEIKQIADEVVLLFDRLQALSEQYKEVLMPGYTHLQRAQPIVFAHHLLAYAEMFKRDLSRVIDAKERMNYSPLGACALAGTTYPIDRSMTASLLGFDSFTKSTLDGVADRDFCIELASALSICMVHLSRLCEEIILRERVDTVGEPKIYHFKL